VTTVLFVDDNRVVRELMKVYLSGKDVRILEATDGVEALAVVQQRAPDLIVADLRMPRLDGLALCATLRANARTRAIPVLILTSNPTSDQAASCLRAGASEVLAKPIDPSTLFAAMSRALAGRACVATEAR
jgi:CheY-like chemotaxis protein